MMIPTLIRIPEEEHKIYKEFALEKGWSLAEFFRKSARSKTGLGKKKTNKKYSIWDLGTKIVYSGGPKDGSVNADKYYYEFEANKRRLK